MSGRPEELLPRRPSFALTAFNLTCASKNLISATELTRSVHASSLHVAVTIRWRLRKNAVTCYCQRCERTAAKRALTCGDSVKPQTLTRLDSNLVIFLERHKIRIEFSLDVVSAEKIRMRDGDSILVMVKDGTVIHYSPNMSLPHVEFVRRTTCELPERAWIGTVSKLDGQLMAITRSTSFVISSTAERSRRSDQKAI